MVAPVRSAPHIRRGPFTPPTVPDSNPLHHDPFLTRRGFLGAVAGLAGTAALAACSSKPGDGSDTGAGTPTDSGPKVDSGATRTTAAAAGSLQYGLQLYTAREAMGKDLDGTLAALAAAGYKHVETAGYAGKTAQEFKALLDKHGLHAASMHVPIQMLRTNAAAVLADAKLFGAQWVVCPWMDEKERTPAGYQKVGEDLAKLAASWKGENVGVAYHNHDFEFKDVGAGKTGLDTIFEAAGPDVYSELDLYWTVKAGHDPVTWMHAHHGKVRLVHVKDAGPPPDRTMTDPGKGTIDFKHILTEFKAQGLQYGFVEHDNPTDAVATARTGLAYLNGLGL